MINKRFYKGKKRYFYHQNLMYGNLPATVDPILQKKIEFIKKGLLKIDENFIL